MCNTWTTGWDQLELRDSAGTVLASDWGSGDFFSMGWVTPAGGSFSLAIRNVGTCSFTPDALKNCTTTCDGVPVSRTQTGAVVGSYEFRRYQTGASPFWTPLRFPGQYYDAESELAENWNRYYEPTIGRYLEPEPELQNPRYSELIAKEGHSVLAYAYASNNPLANTDANGLYGTSKCDYYQQRCAESGGDYYCKTAQDWCKKFPAPPGPPGKPDPNPDPGPEGWPRCTRLCLQDCDRKQHKDQNSCPVKPDSDKGPWDPTSPSFPCHVQCYISCAWSNVTGG